MENQTEEKEQTWFERLTERDPDEAPDIDYVTMLEELEYR